MTHERVFDECEALLIEPVLLDRIVDEIEGGVTDDIGRERIACEECETGLPRGAFVPQAFEIFYGLPAQLLARGGVGSDLDGIFDLNSI